MTSSSCGAVIESIGLPPIQGKMTKLVSGTMTVAAFRDFLWLKAFLVQTNRSFELLLTTHMGQLYFA